MRELKGKAWQLRLCAINSRLEECVLYSQVSWKAGLVDIANVLVRISGTCMNMVMGHDPIDYTDITEYGEVYNDRILSPTPILAIVEWAEKDGRLPMDFNLEEAKPMISHMDEVLNSVSNLNEAKQGWEEILAAK